MGRLHLIPTPLGNLADLAPRSRHLLSAVDVLFCEDTRTTSALLAKLEIPSPTLVALHDHNERQRVQQVLTRLESGDVGLVSEAGTPVLSDPGFVVVRAAIEAGFEVVSVPGPSAAVAAVVASGLPVDRFLFVGFPPRQKGRTAWLEALRSVPATLVFYESPKRIVALLRELQGFGERRAALAVNLSKRGERFVRGTVGAIADALEAEERVRGELTLVVEGFAGNDEEAVWERADVVIAGLLGAGAPVGAIRDAVVAALGLPKRPVYQRILELRDGGASR